MIGKSLENSSKLNEILLETHDYMLQIYVYSSCVLELKFCNGTRLVPSSFLIFTSWFLILAKAFQNGYVVACSTAPRSAAETIEMSGHGTVPCLAKLIQHTSTADWIKL